MLFFFFYSISGWYSYLWLPFISLVVSIFPSILRLFSSNSLVSLFIQLLLLVYNADNSVGGNEAPCYHNSNGIDNSRKGPRCEGCSRRSAPGWPVLVRTSTTYSLSDSLCSLYGTIFKSVIYISTNNLFSFPWENDIHSVLAECISACLLCLDHGKQFHWDHPTFIFHLHWEPCTANFPLSLCLILFQYAFKWRACFHQRIEDIAIRLSMG